MARFSREEPEALLDALIPLTARNTLLDKELSVIIDATDLKARPAGAASSQGTI